MTSLHNGNHHFPTAYQINSTFQNNNTTSNNNASNTSTANNNLLSENSNNNGSNNLNDKQRSQNNSILNNNKSNNLLNHNNDNLSNSLDVLQNTFVIHLKKIQICFKIMSIEIFIYIYRTFLILLRGMLMMMI